MTSKQATQIIQWLKEGKSYKTGHYHYSYHTFSYDEEQQMIKEFVQDHTFNVFEPTEETLYLSAKKYIKNLLDYGDFLDIKKRMGLDAQAPKENDDTSSR
jgi:hypothetical protein